MADPAHRARRWRAKYNIERVKGTLEDLRDEMAARYQAAIADVTAMETKVREVLNANGVSTSLYVPYLNFGRELYKLSRQKGITGESFAMAAKVLLDKWHARGCDEDILAQIRSDVFSVGEPK